MRTIKHWALAAAAAAALALAGCGGGGGSSSTAPTTPTDPPPPSALSFATDLNGSVGCVDDAFGRRRDGGLGPDDGHEGCLGEDRNTGFRRQLHGGDDERRRWCSNAQSRTLMDAIEAAKADKMEAEEAKAGTDDADVIEALDQAIEAAETEIEAAEEILGGDDLAMLRRDGHRRRRGRPEGPPPTRVREVAMADRHGARAYGYRRRLPQRRRNFECHPWCTDVPAATVAKLRTSIRPAASMTTKGMTWMEQLVGSDNHDDADRHLVLPILTRCKCQ